jgi:glycine C-acetyltransferase
LLFKPSAGTFKNERVITSPQSASVSIAGRDGTVLNFCANNYLGLSDHPSVVAAAKRALDTHGNGLASVRFICGTQDIHKSLESRITAFMDNGHGDLEGRTDTILFPSCFDANAAIFETLLTGDDVVLSDELNHASIIDGIRLSKPRAKLRYRHMDLEHLDELLSSEPCRDARARLIVTDGVFSMDGDIAPLRELCDLAERHSALVMVDDSHASGFLGRTGRGSAEHCGVEGRVDIVTSTLGKALGGASGGFIWAPREIVSLLRNRARPYLFSNTVAPAVVGACEAVFEIIAADPALRDTLESNTARFRAGMTAAGFSLRPGEHAIVPIMLGDARLAGRFAEEMLAEGVYVIGFSFPVVPKDTARIRVQISAAHSEAQIDDAIAKFEKVGRKLGVIE